MAGVEEVIRNIDRWFNNKRLGSYEIAQNELCPMLQQYAKAKRPWTDRTGNARRGLTSEAKLRGANELVILLYHDINVPYGVHLEYMKAGKYAILRPTMNRFKGMMIKRIEDYWSR